MTALEITNYLKALKTHPLKDVKMATSERKKAFNDQEKKCARCKKDLRPYYYKFITDPVTKKIEVICLNCAIPVFKR